LGKCVWVAQFVVRYMLPYTAHISVCAS